jgi:hypothetical protein
MGELSYDSGLLKRYLLGALPPDQQDSVEEKFFTENDLFIELLDAEDQLIGDYLSGRLSAADHTRFERHYLTLPDRRSEVEFAGLFRETDIERLLTEPATPYDRARDWLRHLIVALRANLPLTGAATAALVLVAGVGVWLATRQYLEQPADRGGAGVTAPDRSAVITLELSPGRPRSTGETPKAVKGARARAIELKLAAGPAEFSNYRGKLQRLEEEAVEVWTSDALKWEQTSIGDRVVTWEIPTDKLSSGDYQVKLEGVYADDSSESIGAYHFKVIEE